MIRIYLPPHCLQYLAVRLFRIDLLDQLREIFLVFFDLHRFPVFIHPEDLSVSCAKDPFQIGLQIDLKPEISDVFLVIRLFLYPYLLLYRPFQYKNRREPRISILADLILTAVYQPLRSDVSV